MMDLGKKCRTVVKDKIELKKKKRIQADKLHGLHFPSW
jgi:hypothetical protein